MTKTNPRLSSTSLAPAEMIPSLQATRHGLACPRRRRPKFQGALTTTGVFVEAALCRHPVRSPLAAIGVKRLVQIDPEDAGEERYRWHERQEQEHRPDRGFRDPPAGDGPEKAGYECDDGQSQCVADVHGSEEVAGFAFVTEMADGAAFIHFREAEEDGVVKDLSDAAAGTAMMKNVVEGRECAGFHGTGSV